MITLSGLIHDHKYHTHKNIFIVHCVDLDIGDEKESNKSRKDSESRTNPEGPLDPRVSRKRPLAPRQLA
jgi:hypothetical protein